MLYAKRFATSEPTIEVFGKPTISTFDYARRLLEERDGVIRPQQATLKIERIYMVGGVLRSRSTSCPCWWRTPTAIHRVIPLLLQ